MKRDRAEYSTADFVMEKGRLPHSRGEFRLWLNDKLEFDTSIEHAIANIKAPFAAITKRGKVRAS